MGGLEVLLLEHIVSNESFDHPEVDGGASENVASSLVEPVSSELEPVVLAALELSSLLRWSGVRLGSTISKLGC